MENQIIRAIKSIANLKGLENNEIIIILKQSIQEVLPYIDTININIDTSLVTMSFKTEDSIKYVNIDQLSRIEIQKIKSAISHHIFTLEKQKLYDIYKQKEHTIINGQIKGFSHDKIFIDLGELEGEINKNDIIPGEKFFKNTIYRFHISNVSIKKHIITIKLDRSSEEFVNLLLKEEIPEMKSGILETVKISRIPGYKTCLRVKKIQPNYPIDILGSCLGPKGNRSRNIISELRGEKFEIIYDYEDIIMFIKRMYGEDAIINYEYNPDNNSDLSICINSKLAPKIIGKNAYNIKLLEKIYNIKITITT